MAEEVGGVNGGVVELGQTVARTTTSEVWTAGHPERNVLVSLCLLRFSRRPSFLDVRA